MAKPTPRRFSRDPKKPASPLMRILSSPKTTLVLGLFAFGSILFYKQFILSKDIGLPKKTVQDIIQEKSLFDEKKKLGRARDGGMLLTAESVDTGDILIRQHNGRLDLAVVAKRNADFLVLRPASAITPLMTWLRQGDGYFALYRLPPTPRPKLLRLLATLQELADAKQLPSLPTITQPTKPSRSTATSQPTKPSRSTATSQPTKSSRSTATSQPTQSAIHPDSLRNLWILQAFRQQHIKLPTHTLHPHQEQRALQSILNRSVYNDLTLSPRP